MKADEIVVFTDGAAKGNPGPGGWGAIVATPEGEVVELGGGSAHTTNNKMELGGAIHALEHLRGRDGSIRLHTDSTYLIDGITKWIHGWRRRGWKTSTGTDVLNRDLWERLSALLAERGKENRVHWHHVRGHAGIPGNERCDEIAVAFAEGVRPDLYRGPVETYPVSLLATADAEAMPATKKRAAPRPARGGGKPFSYVSLLGGVAMRHATWPECERRVKGQAGARFKKAMSREDESQILRAWGLSGTELG